MDKAAQTKKMAAAVVGVVRTICAKALAPIDEGMKSFNARLEALSTKFAELPTPKDGRDGVDGKDGAPGADGKDGINGKDGRDGIDGKNGADGLNGKDGAPGADGKDGLNGKDGRDGIDGKNGADGLNGKDGAEGRDGRDGKQGPAGRDALEIDIRPHIDETKIYPAGVFASHNGGLWHSKHETNGMDGWVCLVEGFPTITFERITERKFKFVAITSSGKKQEAEYSVPAILDKDVFREGVTYEPGDAVSWGGAMWIAKKETASKPGTDDGWRLAVKRGRDDKDGVVRTIDPNKPVKL